MKTRVAVFTADPEFEASVRAAFGGQGQIELDVVSGRLADQRGIDHMASTVVVADIDANRPDEIQALQRIANRLSAGPPVVVVTQAFNETVARQLLQVRVADFLVKPIAGVDLVRACARVAQEATGVVTKEAQIYTFLPAAGGVGVTTLAIQTALLLLRSGQRSGATTCLVDLDFQHGACSCYLDLEPRLDLDEIEPQPERLDRQLLEIMLTHHASGLAVIAAPHRPAEMRTFDPDVVTRLLDLVSARFDYVVIDMPRTWFSWTDNVLIGSNQLFIVTEMTVPGLRHAKQFVAAINERLGDAVQPQVIVNRFEQRMFGPGLRRADLEQTLGPAFAGTIPNNYGLVREAIDRGVPLEDVKPRNNIASELEEADRPPRARQDRAARRRGRESLAAWRGHDERGGSSMLGRFTARRVAAPALSSRTGAGAGARTPSCSRSPPSRCPIRRRRGEPPPEREAARRQGAAAPAADRGDQPLGAGTSCRRTRSAGTSSGLVAQYILAERLALNVQELESFVDEILDEMIGLGPIEPLLKDPTVNDILINGHECVYVERRGVLEPTLVRFKDEAHLLRIVNKIVSAVGRRVDETAAAVRRAPARRLARQRRGAADRGRRPAGLDPKILQEAVQPAASWSTSARCGRRWPSSWPPPSGRASRRSSRAAPAPARPRCSTRCPRSSRTRSA